MFAFFLLVALRGHHGIVAGAVESNTGTCEKFCLGKFGRRVELVVMEVVGHLVEISANEMCGACSVLDG